MPANVKENLQELRMLVKKMIPAEQVDPVLRVTIQDNLQSGESGKKSEDPIKVQLLANATGKSGPRLFGLHPSGLFTFGLSPFGLQRHLDYPDGLPGCLDHQNLDFTPNRMPCHFDYFGLHYL